MKKLLFLIPVCLLAVAAVSPKFYRKVTYRTSLECEHCAEKIRENISYVKGVRDLSVDVPSKTVTVSFDTVKTDTLRLRRELNKLGYSATVIDFQ